MSLMNLILVLWKFPETRQILEKKNFDFTEGLHNIRKVFLMKNLRWLFFGGFALYFGWSVFNEFVPLLLRERFDFSLSHIGEFYAYTGAWFAIGALIATRFVHRFSPEKIAVISTFLVAICMLTFSDSLSIRIYLVDYPIDAVFFGLCLSYGHNYYIQRD